MLGGGRLAHHHALLVLGVARHVVDRHLSLLHSLVVVLIFTVLVSTAVVLFSIRMWRGLETAHVVSSATARRHHTTCTLTIVMLTTTTLDVLLVILVILLGGMLRRDSSTLVIGSQLVLITAGIVADSTATIVVRYSLAFSSIVIISFSIARRSCSAHPQVTICVVVLKR